MHSSSIDAFDPGNTTCEAFTSQDSGPFSHVLEPRTIRLFQDELHKKNDFRSSDDSKSSKPLKDKKKSEAIIPSLQDLHKEVQHTLGLSQQETTQALQNVQEIAAQIVKAMLVLNSPKIEGQAIRISLDNLGILDGVSVDIQLHKQSLNITFFAQEALAYDFLKKQLPELKKTLEAKKLKAVDSIQLDCHAEVQTEPLVVSHSESLAFQYQ